LRPSRTVNSVDLIFNLRLCPMTGLEKRPFDETQEIVVTNPLVTH
jgi:hypothetical protein